MLDTLPKADYIHSRCRVPGAKNMVQCAPPRPPHNRSDDSRRMAAVIGGNALLIYVSVQLRQCICRLRHTVTQNNVAGFQPAHDA
jgi:hypothetical protein